MRHWLVNRTPFGQKMVSDAFKNGSRCSPAGQGTGAGRGRECNSRADGLKSLSSIESRRLVARLTIACSVF
jgi:hypothetical protein